MRILYLHQHFVTPAMRGGTRSYEFGRRLVSMGHDVQMIASDRGRRPIGRDWYETEESGVRVHWLPVPYDNSMSYPRRLRAFGEFATRAGFKAIQLEGDIVFATSTPLTIALPALLTCRRLHIPLVFEVRDLWPQVPIEMGILRNPALIGLARTLESATYEASSAIVALSPGMKKGVIRAGGDPKKVHVIPNACDFDVFDVGDGPGRAFRESQPWLEDRPLLVYTGAISTANDVAWIVDLAERIVQTRPDVRFLIVGEGREKANVIERARRAGVLDQSVFFREGIEKMQIAEILSAADMALVVFADVPALTTSSPNKAFDALASGTPVVVNYPGWLADAITHKNAGLAVGRDCEHAKNVLLDALDDRTRMEGLRSGARRLAKSRFDRDQLSRQLNSILQGVIDQS